VQRTGEENIEESSSRQLRFSEAIKGESPRKHTHSLTSGQLLQGERETEKTSKRDCKSTILINRTDD
jgi:hypothetical protein